MKLSDIDLDLRLPKPPMVLVAVLVIGAFVPMGIASAIWYKRNTFDPNSRVHLIQDMDHQAKGKAQSHSEVFKTGRTMQAYVPGTVAWGRDLRMPDPTMLKDDDLAYRGFEIAADTGQLVTSNNSNGKAVPKYLDGFPNIVNVDQAFIKHGQSQFMIHCYTCHGADGRGLGPTKRAMDELAAYDLNQAEDKTKTGTVALKPANLTEAKFAAGTYTNGQLFDVITQGKGTMNALGPMIPVKDRWAIIAYVRAMQKSQQQQATAE